MSTISQEAGNYVLPFPTGYYQQKFVKIYLISIIIINSLESNKLLK